MSRVLVVLVLLVASAAAFAQTPSERVEEFLRQAATSEMDKAMDRLLADSGLAETKPQVIVTLKGQVKLIMELYGAPLGTEKVWEEDLSPSLKRLVYLQKFEKAPIAWEFYFYKPKDSWRLNAINFKDQVGALVGAMR